MKGMMMMGAAVLLACGSEAAVRQTKPVRTAKPAAVSRSARPAGKVRAAAGKTLTAEDSKTRIGEPRYIPVRWNSLGTSITWYNSHAGATFQKGYQTRVIEQLKFDGFENPNGVCPECR